MPLWGLRWLLLPFMLKLPFHPEDPPEVALPYLEGRLGAAIPPPLIKSLAETATLLPRPEILLGVTSPVPCLGPGQGLFAAADIPEALFLPAIALTIDLPPCLSLLTPLGLLAEGPCHHWTSIPATRVKPPPHTLVCFQKGEVVYFPSVPGYQGHW